MLLMSGPEKSKKIATLIIGGMKDKGFPKEEDKGEDYDGSSPSMFDSEGEDEEMDAGSAKKSAARALMRSIKEGDESTFMDALETIVDQLIMARESSEEYSDDDERKGEDY